MTACIKATAVAQLGQQLKHGTSVALKEMA